MSNSDKKFNIIHCPHERTAAKKNIHPKNYLYDYCTQCGSISILYNDCYYYTLKPNTKQKELEVDPIKIVLEMKKSENKNHPNLNNEFNLSEEDLKYPETQEKILLYLSKRKLLLLYLQNITKVLNYSDLSFYHCLLLADLYLCRNIDEDMSDEKLLYILIGFFLIASKFKETDIFEPELYIFCNLDWEFMLTVEKILYYEAKCLKNIGYDFFIYSTYDWLSIFMGNGYVFEGEIDEENPEEINEIHSYTFKILITLTPKSIFIKYSPLYNAISIIQICREDKIDKKKLNKELFNKLLSLYDLKFSDYENCYNEIKATTNKCLSDKKSQNSNNNKARTLKRTENKTLDDLNFNNKDNKINENKKKYKSCEKELNDNNNRTGKKATKVETQRKLNLKQKLGGNQLKLHLFPSNNINQEKKKFGLMNILNNNSNNINKGLMKKQKTLQLVDYNDGNFPKIKHLKHESDKVYQTEGEMTTGRNKQLFTINKNGLFINYLKDKKNKNKSGTSLDIKLFYNNNKSPFGFNRLLRNVTYDALKNNDKKIIKKLGSSNVNLASNKKTIKILNKSSDALKYNSGINPKMNDLLYELKSKENKEKKNNKLNIYKNNNKNEGSKYFSRQSTDYLENNNIKMIKPEKSLVANENKKETIVTNKLEKEDIKDLQETKISSIEQNKDKLNNINFLNFKKKKFNFANIKYNSNLLNNANDLLLKKMIFKNQKMPRKLKLKMNK